VARRMFKDIMIAVQYLHKEGVCHRDIKPSNILVYNGIDKIKLADFNISKLCKDAKNMQMLTHFSGNEAFQAPEMINHGIYNEKIDTWSSGCVLYTMLVGF
jgi:calcium/calmodulin-dependent protein kinase I